MTRGKFPKYHRQKSDSGDRAYMTLQGRRFCLGPYDSPESRQEYKRILAEWLASGSQPVVAVEAMTVVELAAWFLACAKTYYRRPDGSPTTEISNFRQVIRPV